MTDTGTDQSNRKIVLAARPTGTPDDSTMQLQEEAIPQPAKGQMLVRNHYLSLDPYMRGMMSERNSYAEPIPLGGTMVGATIAEVLESQLDGYAPGDWVMTYGGWQDYALSDGTMTFKLDPAMKNKSWALGILGMPGLTAWSGLREIGKPKPGETLVVAAALGPVGSAVGQFAKRMGLRVVGVAGGAEKCRIAVEELGFDACIDHRADDFEEQLAAAVPDGIDIYFENVGGRVFRAVVPLLNQRARVPLCGNIVTYNNPDQPNPDLPDYTDVIMAKFQQFRVLAQGFLVSDYMDLWPEFHAEVMPWIEAGEIHYVEDISDGLEAAPQGLRDVLSGANIGKKVIKLTDAPA